MTKRDELVKQLGIIFISKDTTGSWLENMADFILEDRRRISKPLVTQLKNIKSALQVIIVKTAMEEEMIRAIDETLKLSGVGDE